MLLHRIRQSVRTAIALIITATIIAYGPAMRAPFEFDDATSIPGNATIRTLWPPSVPLNPPENTSVAGRPVVNYSLAINAALNRWLGVNESPDPDGPNKTVGLHIVNLLMHLGCGLLLFGVIRRTFLASASAGAAHGSADGIAVTVVALWLLHPIQTEAVNYLIQRTELFVSVCYAGVLYASIRAWDASSARSTVLWRALAVVVSLLGMGSKEVMITVPLAVMLYDRAFRTASWTELVASPGRSLFYFGLGGTSAVAVAMIAANARFDTVGFHLGITWYQYLYSQAWAIAHYLRLVLWPDQLTFDYGQRPIAGPRGVVGSVLLSAFFIATVVAWTRARTWGWFGFLGALFFLLMAPSSSVVPIATEIAAERRVYLALAPVLLLGVIGVDWLRRRAVTGSVSNAQGPWSHMRIVVAGLCVLLAAATFARSRTYADSEGLWRDTVLKAPDNPRAYDNLAATMFYHDPPRLAEAQQLYERAIQVDSTYVHAWPGLASVAVDQGRITDAESLLVRVLRIDPGYSDAVDHLGKLLLRTGRPASALPYLEQFAVAYPGENALMSVATAYLQLGRYDNASAALTRVLALNPGRVDALRYLGGLLVEQGHGLEALPLLERAVSVGSLSPVDVGLLSIAYAQVGRADDAVRAARSASDNARGNASVFILAGRAMLYAQRRDDAVQYFEAALRLSPGSAEASAYLEQARAMPSR